MTIPRFAPPLLWAALVLILTSIPSPSLVVDPPVPGTDKVGHLALYGVLAFLSARAAPAARGPLAMLALLAAISAFGAVDEWHQQFVPGRSQDRADWFADTAGAAIGIFIAQTARRRREPAT